MKYLMFVALGGAGGAVARYLASLWVHSLWEGKLPLGTLLVNVVGSAMIGIAYVLIERNIIHPDWRSAHSPSVIRLTSSPFMSKRYRCE